jgi:hypothetical protein
VDFAIAPESGCGLSGWEVLCLHHQRGAEVVVRLASFGYREHAEAFLNDLLGTTPGVEPAGA